MSWGHNIPVNTIPISLENVHSDYADSDSSIEVRYTRGNTLYLLFPAGWRRNDVLGNKNAKAADYAEHLSESGPRYSPNYSSAWPS